MSNTRRAGLQEEGSAKSFRIWRGLLPLFAVCSSSCSFFSYTGPGVHKSQPFFNRQILFQQVLWSCWSSSLHGTFVSLCLALVVPYSSCTFRSARGRELEQQTKGISDPYRTRFPRCLLPHFLDPGIPVLVCDADDCGQIRSGDFWWEPLNIPPTSTERLALDSQKLKPMLAQGHGERLGNPCPVHSFAPCFRDSPPGAVPVAFPQKPRLVAGRGNRVQTIPSEERRARVFRDFSRELSTLYIYY
jgi:hypothetical protein